MALTKLVGKTFVAIVENLGKLQSPLPHSFYHYGVYISYIYVVKARVHNFIGTSKIMNSW